MKLIELRAKRSQVYFYRLLFLLLAIPFIIDMVGSYKSGVIEEKYRAVLLNDDPFSFFLSLSSSVMLALLFIYLGTIGTKARSEKDENGSNDIEIR